MHLGRTALLLLLAAAELVRADPSDDYGEKQPIRRRQVTKEELDASAKRCVAPVRVCDASCCSKHGRVTWFGWQQT